MRLTITIILFTSVITVFSQFGITVNGNYSVIGSHSRTEEANSPITGFTGFATLTTSYTLNESYESRGGYGVEVTYNKAIAGRFEFQTGINYSAISYKRNTEVIYETVNDTDSDFIIRSVDGIITIIDSPGTGQSPRSVFDNSSIGETTVTHLTIPVFVNYSLSDKIKIGLGVKNSFLLTAKETQFHYSATFSGPIISPIDDRSKEGFKSYNLIGSLLINYSFNDKWSIETTCNQGLTGIYEEEKQVGGNAKMRNVTLGINYQL